MRRLLVVAALAAFVAALAAVAGVATTPAGGVPADASFRTRDGAIACAFSRGVVACRNRTASHAVVLERDGESRPERRRVAWDERTPVLRITQSWWHGGFVRRASLDGVRCSSVGGDGAIFVGRAHFGGIR